MVLLTEALPPSTNVADCENARQFSAQFGEMLCESVVAEKQRIEAM